MRTREEKRGFALGVIFGAMLLAVVLFLVLGEVLLPRENGMTEGNCTVLTTGWKRIYEDGTVEMIKLPGHFQAEWGETVRLERDLSADQEDTWFCMRASQQDMRVYVEDELRKEYTTAGSRLFGNASASAFVFWEMKEEDAGKTLVIELVSDSEYSGFLNEVCAGDKFDIVHKLLKECAVVLVVSVCMFIISSVTILAGFLTRWIYKRKVAITYLGLGIWQLSLAMLAESRMRQLFLPNSSVAAHVGFLLTMLIPYPFMVYVSRLQKGRYERIYRLISVAVAGNFVACTFLQLVDIADLAETMVLSYILIAVMVLVIAFTIGVDLVRGRSAEYGEVLIGLIAMLIVSVWEIYLTFVPQLPYFGGVALSMGLIVLLVTAGIKTAKDMLLSEQKAAGEPEPTGEPELPDELTAIDKARGMVYCDNNESFYREMLEVYRKQGEEYIPQLYRLIEEKNWKEVRTIVHAVKSTSMTIGATALYLRAKKLEAWLKNDEVETFTGELPGFMEHYKAVLKRLDKETIV